jgi:ATP-dependent Clp protease ATP-binding subunit ClpB
MVQAQVMKVVREHFRPEFLNRLDEIVLFSRLQKADMTRIVDIQIARLQSLLEDRHITLELDGLAHQWLANEGYDPVYGARPLKRVVQRSLQNPLAELLLEGTIHDGENVKVSSGENGLLINGRDATTVLN